MKKLITIIFLISGVFFICNAQQTIYYRYDDSGNRKTRSISMPVNKSAEEDKEIIDKKLISDKIGKLDVNIYPNPTKGLLIIEFTNLGEDTQPFINLYSVEGKNLIRIITVQSKNDLDLSALPAGNYYLVITEGEFKSNWTVVKE